VCDASSAPSAVVSTTQINAGGAELIFFVPIGYYCQITCSGGTINYWNEYPINSGTLTDSGELSGSRVVGSVYHNTSGNAMFLSVRSTSGTPTMVIVSDSSASPSTVVFEASPVVTSVVPAFVPIPNGDYYSVTGITIGSWHEFQLSGVALTKSANLSATSPVQRKPVVAFPNISGKSTLVLVCGTGGGYTMNASVDPSVPPINISGIWEGNGSTSYKTTLAVWQPSDYYAATVDSGTFTVTGWFEYTLG
jgi:hypothetical protein